VGRSFASVRLGVRAMAERWEQTDRTLAREDRRSARHLTGLAKTHSSAAFFGCDTPLEAVVFSALAGISRDLQGGGEDVGP
jgi:hypothetical protein